MTVGNTYGVTLFAPVKDLTVAGRRAFGVSKASPSRRLSRRSNFTANTRGRKKGKVRAADKVGRKLNTDADFCMRMKHAVSLRCRSLRDFTHS